MRNRHPPVHPFPGLYSPYQEMTGEKVHAVHDFLLELANSFGNRYASQLHRTAAR